MDYTVVVLTANSFDVLLELLCIIAAMINMDAEKEALLHK